MNEFALFCDSALHRIKNNIKFNNQNVHSSDEPSKRRVNKSRSIALKFRVNSRSYLCSIRIFFIVSECMTMCITLPSTPAGACLCVIQYPILVTVHWTIFEFGKDGFGLQIINQQHSFINFCQQKQK